MSERAVYKVASFVGSDGSWGRGSNGCDNGRNATECNEKEKTGEEECPEEKCCNENRYEKNCSGEKCSGEKCRKEKIERPIAEGNHHIVLYEDLTRCKGSDRKADKNFRENTEINTIDDAKYDMDVCVKNITRENNENRERKLRHLSKEYTPDILVDVTSSDQNCYNANFFQNGRKIQRCGSGYLAAAHIIFKGISSDSVFLHTSIGPVFLRRHRKNVSFQMSVLAYQYKVLIGPWKMIVNRAITKVTLVGEGSDYCIIELNHEKDVKTCDVNSRRLCRYSNRGLIVTAKSIQKNNDYVLRYFAPQYGQKEDAATGSANAMVGRYWQHRLQKRKVRGRQLSETGGEFTVEACGLQQRVIGRTQVLPFTTNKNVKPLSMDCLNING